MLELGMDEIKKWHSKEQIRMIWRCDVDERREGTYENYTHKNGGKGPTGKPRTNQKGFKNEKRKWGRNTIKHEVQTLMRLEFLL